jgi:hypothetical protein
MMRRMHDSVRLRYHKLMRAANAEEAALLHSHNDSIRFLSWLFAVMKVRHSQFATFNERMCTSTHIQHLLPCSSGCLWWQACITASAAEVTFAQPMS